MEKITDAFIPQAFLLHGPERSGKQTAMERIASMYTHHWIQLDLALVDLYEAQEDLVSDIKRILA